MPSSQYPGKKDNKTDPWKAIADFCRSYHHHEVQSMLWDWLVTAVSRNNSIYDDGKERSSLFLLYENITLLVAAAYTFHEQPGGTPPKKNSGKNAGPGPEKP